MSPPKNPPAMCCTTRIGTGKPDGSEPRSPSSACGPPVEEQMPTDATLRPRRETGALGPGPVGGGRAASWRPRPREALDAAPECNGRRGLALGQPELGFRHRVGARCESGGRAIGVTTGVAAHDKDWEWRVGHDRPSGLDASHARQLEVHRHQVGTVLRERAQQLLSRRAGRDDAQVGVQLEKGTQGVCVAEGESSHTTMRATSPGSSSPMSRETVSSSACWSNALLDDVRVGAGLERPAARSSPPPTGR